MPIDLSKDLFIPHIFNGIPKTGIIFKKYLLEGLVFN